MDDFGDDKSRERSWRLWVLKALAIAGALTFLAIVMVNACATYAAPTKAGPVVNPAPAAPGSTAAPAATAPPPSYNDPTLMAPTKAGPVFRPRPAPPPAQSAPEPQQQAPSGGW
jgi:hypothetical protein